MSQNVLYYGDNLEVLRRHVKDETVDLVYLDPPFNSNQDYNVLFAEKDGARAAAQIRAFADAWQWDQGAAEAYEQVVESSGGVAEAMFQRQISLAVRKMDCVKIRLRENVVRRFALTLTSILREPPHIRLVARRKIRVTPRLWIRTWNPVLFAMIHRIVFSLGRCRPSGCGSDGPAHRDRPGCCRAAPTRQSFSGPLPEEYAK